jgi:hypothetical protein
MTLPTAVDFLESVYRIRADTFKHLQKAHVEGCSSEIRKLEKLLSKSEKLVVQAEAKCGVVHKPINI